MVTASPSERRTPGAFVLFEYGYRPFFLLAALHGAVLVPVWVAAVLGWLTLPVEMEVSWHAHQMVYGFAAAGLAGFMLTAVPNWTGAPPLRGAPLAALALLWLVGRLAMTLTTVFPPRVAAGIDLAFIPALARIPPALRDRAGRTDVGRLGGHSARQQSAFRVGRTPQSAGILQKFTAFVPRYQRFESGSLQR